MKKVLFVVTKDDVGGAQKYVKELAENLDQTLFQPKILAGGKRVRFLSNFVRPYFLFLNDLLAIGELFFIFRKEKPDVVHLNSSKAGVLGAFAAKLAGVPKVVFTAHGWVFNPDNRINPLSRWVYILLHKIAARFQDIIVSVSQYDNDLALRRGVASPEKLRVVRNGIHPVPLFSKNEARRLLKKLTGAPADERGIWVGSVGRLVTEKNYSTLVEAAAAVPQASFFIIGSGYLKKNLESKIKELGLEKRFFIAENLSPAAPYLKAFDVFALTSVKEGLPYTILEAMAAEIPLVVTRIGGMTEIVEGCGLVMPAKEPAEIARAIRHYLNNPEEARHLAAAAKKYQEENLTLERMIRETEKIYLS